jgi:cation-transporting P-type ATPase I
MSWAESFRWAKRRFGPRMRRAYLADGRAHIEFRPTSAHGRAELRLKLEASLSGLRHVQWVEVNAYTHRVVIAFDKNAYPLERLIRLVEEAEAAAALDQLEVGDWARDYPADADPIERLRVELGADAAALLVGTLLQLSPVRPSTIAGHTASAIAILRATSRIRRVVEQQLGRERAELVLSLASAAALALAQRPLSSLVDVVHKRAMLRERVAQQRVFEHREPELCKQPTPASDLRTEPRPNPLPRGPIEEYSDRAWAVSLAGAGVSLLATRSWQRAAAALLGALPKPAKLGRDVFAADLGKVLAARGVLVLDASVLRRLDRVDCLVLEQGFLTKDRFEIGEIVTRGAISPSEARAQTQALFDPDRPVELREADGWTLGPPSLLPIRIEEELADRTAALARRGALVLALAHDGTVVALVEMLVIPQTGVEEVVAAAHAADLRVVIVARDESLLHAMHADDIIPEHEGLYAGIRRLQRQGRCVALVATEDSRALDAADCGIGLLRPGAPTPWGAALVCREDLSDVRFLIEACVEARTMAKQSVDIALAAATLGALVSAGGIVSMTTSRVMTVVNAATLVSMANGVRGSVTLDRRPLPPPRDRTPWHALDAQGVLARLDSSDQGLSRGEIVRRSASQSRGRPALAELAEAVTDEIFNPLAPLLAAGAGLSAAVGSMADAAMVGGVVGLNALVGGVQRVRAERAIRDLSRTARRKAVVRRAGVKHEVDASVLVRGDVIELQTGDVVPADCRILTAVALEVDASSLTGESLPVPKSAAPSFAPVVADRSSMLYEGTSLAAGRAVAVVVAAGEETEARRGGGAAPKRFAQSGVDQRLRSLIDLTAPVALGAGVGLVGLGLLRGRKLPELVGTGVSLAVASVPEGLPLIATAAQLAAAKRLVARGALVRNTRSIEALGRVQVLCVDKTGTLTEGRLELVQISDGSHAQPTSRLDEAGRATLAAALRATTPSRRQDDTQFDPTDAALLRAATRLGVHAEDGHAGYQHESELPFEAGRSYHAVLGRTAAGERISVKGAPEVVLGRCVLDPDTREALQQGARALGDRGLRVLAVAEQAKGTEGTLELDACTALEFCGLLAFSDPVRPSAAAALERLRQAGVRTVMLTGDHPSTARAIAEELDLAAEPGVLLGSELARLTDDELDRTLPGVAIFARVTPAQKVRVVRALQRIGQVVAMVGDGANDAPAIRLADAGVAIGEQSTSAARGAADVVVTDGRIETLVDAIVEGRAMWASVRDAVSILIGGNLGEIGFALAAGLVDGQPPLNARQLLLVNVLTDAAPAMVIALRPPTEATLASLASEGPDASLGQPLTREIALRAATTALGAGSAWLLARVIGDAEGARTVGLVALVGTQLGQTLASGEGSRPVLLTTLGSAAVLGAIVQTPGLSRLFGCRPLGPLGWLIATGASAAATGLSVYAPRKLPGLLLPS